MKMHSMTDRSFQPFWKTKKAREQCGILGYPSEKRLGIGSYLQLVTYFSLYRSHFEWGFQPIQDEVCAINTFRDIRIESGTFDRLNFRPEIHTYRLTWEEKLTNRMNQYVEKFIFILYSHLIVLCMRSISRNYKFFRHGKCLAFHHGGWHRHFTIE